MIKDGFPHAIAVALGMASAVASEMAIGSRIYRPFRWTSMPRRQYDSDVGRNLGPATKVFGHPQT
jgi:hypothetical protein